MTDGYHDRRAFLGGSLAILLAGCTGLTRGTRRPPAPAPWQARQRRLGSLERWDLSGRISVIQGEEGWHGSVRWRQTPGGYSIDLVGPLGQGRIAIDGDAQRVRLRTADGRELTATDADVLLAEVTGLAVPISGLLYWIRGLPAPTPPSADLVGDEEGRLTQLQQGGWSIDFNRYTEIDDLQLPARINARQDGLQVKLAINAWEIAA